MHEKGGKRSERSKLVSLGLQMQCIHLQALFLVSCYFRRENTRNFPHSYFLSAKTSSHQSQLAKETMA